MISTRYKSFFNELFEPVALWLRRLGVSPNQMTVAGLILGILGCLTFLHTRNLYLFIILIVLAGIFDAIDGVLARASGRVTKFGAYLDAMCDRLFEGAVMLAVAIATGRWVLIFLAMLGSYSVSYAKARAAIETTVSNTEWPDLMERFERDIIFISGFFLSELFHIQIAGHDLFFWVLIGLNAAVYFTVIQRILRAKRLIESRSL